MKTSLYITNTYLTDGLIVVFVIGVVTALSACDGLAFDAAGAAAAEGRVEAEVDVFLAVDAHHERRDVDELLPDADVALLDEHARVVDGLGEAQLHHLGLQAALEEILHLQ